jgi:hypothetical protein
MGRRFKWGPALRGKTNLATALVVWILFGSTAVAQGSRSVGAASGAASVDRSAEAQGADFQHFECGMRSPQYWLEELRAAKTRGEIGDPAARPVPPITPGRQRAAPGAAPCLSLAHVFTFEDTAQILLSDFSDGQLIDLLINAANDMMAVYGDIYDFVGIWLNFTPHHQIGTAFYLSIENDVTGIGRVLFDNRPSYGVGGQNIEGFVVMWNIQSPGWQPGSGPGAEFTRIALGHEFEHRFAVFLPNLLDGRQMEGYGGAGCYDAGHWNPTVDNQGSAMGIGEWIGSAPAVLAASFPNFYLFNGDTGGLWSHTELYLMGYESPAEMDLGNSELRYMDNWDCVTGDYFGPISTFSSADIIAAAGPRVPDSAAEDKHYRTGWIMIHLPGSPPNPSELAKAVGIHEQQQTDWSFSTLGRGTIDNSLFDDCNCNDVPDAADIAGGASLDVNGNGIPDECEVSDIPTVSEWGLVGMAVLLLACGLYMLMRRRAAV